MHHDVSTRWHAGHRSIAGQACIAPITGVIYAASVRFRATPLTGREATIFVPSAVITDGAVIANVVGAAGRADSSASCTVGVITLTGTGKLANVSKATGAVGIAWLRWFVFDGQAGRVGKLFVCVRVVEAAREVWIALPVVAAAPPFEATSFTFLISTTDLTRLARFATILAAG